MKFNENLQELHLARNHLGPEDGQHLGNILRSNHTLRSLDVSDNNLQVHVFNYTLKVTGIPTCTWDLSIA